MNRPTLNLKTYSHLAAARRVPTDYEVATTDLLYYLKKGFEVEVPVRAWYDRHQKGSPFACGDWDRFRDPRETTYASYVALQAHKEAHLEAVFRALDAAPPPDERWPATVERTLGPARFAFHGLHMIAAYIGHLAPSGRITVTALLQSADELRRIHRTAYRLAQLRRRTPSFGATSRALWQQDPAWQPLRRTVEQALCAWDWGEALVALNVCAKPLLDNLFGGELAAFARASGDHGLSDVLSSLADDGRWHRDWTAGLLRLAFADRASNRAVVRGWVGRWYPRALEATRAVAGTWGDTGESAAAGAESAAREWLRSVEVEVP